MTGMGNMAKYRGRSDTVDGNKGGAGEPENARKRCGAVDEVAHEQCAGWGGGVRARVAGGDENIGVGTVINVHTIGRVLDGRHCVVDLVVRITNNFVGATSLSQVRVFEEGIHGSWTCLKV